MEFVFTDATSKQDVFDFGVKAILAQGCASVSEFGTPRCRYRGPNGAKCFVGHFIPDEKYSGRFEGESVERVFTKAGIPQKFFGFMRECQDTHDQADGDDFVHKFKAGMLHIATEYALNTDALDLDVMG